MNNSSNNNTQALTVVTEETAVSFYERNPAELVTRQLEREYPGIFFAPDATEEDVENFLIDASEYTGAVTIHVDDFITRKHPTKKTEEPIILKVVGYLKFLKELTNPTTGEVEQKVGVVFKLDFEDGYQFMSFTSTACTNFVNRNFVVRNLPMATDFQKPQYMVVRPAITSKGSTYSFQLVRPPQN